MADKFAEWQARKKAGRYYSPVVKKYMVVKDMKPIAMNLTYNEADRIKRQQIQKTQHREPMPVFDIVLQWEE